MNRNQHRPARQPARAGVPAASPAVQTLFATAVQHQQAGRLDDAERLFRQVLTLNPRHADSLHLLGVVAHRTARDDLAVDLIRQAIAINRKEAVYYSNLGNLLQRQGGLDEAVACYRTALDLKPDLAGAHTNLGNALRELGQADEAIAAYRRTIEINPAYSEAHNNLGVMLLEHGRLDEAIACHRRAIELKPDYPDAHSNLGNALKYDGRLDEAVASYRTSIGLRPDFPEAHSNLGIALQELGQLDEAASCFRRALELNPNHAEAHNNLGNALLEQERLDEAIASFRRALELRPDYPDAHNNLGIALHEQGQVDEAIVCCRRAIELRPDYPEAYDNLGNAFRKQGRLDGAVAAYRQAVELKPEFPDTHANLAMALLARGDMAPAWEEYEWRWKTRYMIKAARDFPQPQWRGEPAEGRTLLIHAEQGFGDTLQFCRYATLAAERGLLVILEVPKPLVRLLRSLSGVDRVVALGEPLPDFDLHCPTLSMPLALGTTLATVPNTVPYLHADPAQVVALRARLDALGKPGPRVGVVWAGNSHKLVPLLAALDRRRSIAPDRLAPLFEQPGLHFVSLQKDGPAAPEHFALTDLMREMADFADTAALIANLDLVISVDTAVAHLAAALGRPVWMMDRFDPDWRWLLGRSDCPWYPTLRIFRQPEPGNWDAVIESVRAELGAFAERTSPPPLEGGGWGEGCVPLEPTGARTPPPAPLPQGEGESASSTFSPTPMPSLVIPTAQSLFAAAAQHQQAGRLDEAEELLQQVLAIDPNHAGSLHLRGVIAYQRGHLGQAVELISQAVAINPGDAQSQSNLGNLLHQQGRLDEAVACYHAAIALNPQLPAAHNNLGNALRGQGLPDEGIASYRRAIDARPDYPEAHNNLGVALAEQGRLEEAIACYRKAIELRPNYPDAFNNLGNALREQSLLDEAIEAFRAALDLKPDYAEAHNNLGIALQDQGRSDDAVASFRAAIDLAPDDPETRVNLGLALKEQGKLDEAAACCEGAIELKPDFPEAHYNRGNVRWEQGRLDEAVASYRRAIELKPEYPGAHVNLGNALREQGLPEEAVACYRRGVELKADYPEAYNNLSIVLLDLGRRKDAMACSRKALELKPDYAEAHDSLGNALRADEQLDAAIASYRRAVACKPDYPDAHSNLAMALLAHGELAAGWEEYEWRWKTGQLIKTHREFPQPEWHGEQADGQTLLIHAEQGFGDTLQFCRYAPLAAARGLRVVLSVPRQLARLLRSLSGVDEVVADGEPLPHFDLHCPMLSLPRVLGTGTLADIPADVPYLHADTAQVAAWRARLAMMGRPGLRVGLVWAGNPRKHLSAGDALDRRRSIAPAHLAPLFEVPGLHFISLQKGGAAAPAQFPLTDVMGEVGDFADTAALIANLDLVISVDTSVAHLAGALGKPVWLLDRFDPCWRWLTGRQDSPWYPALRLFRQPEPGNWEAVIASVQEALGALVTEHAPAATSPDTVPLSAITDVQGLFGDGVRLHQAGRIIDAERIYRQVLDVNPNHTDALHLLGVIGGQTGRHDLAADMISRAIAINPGQAAYHCNLGIALKQQRRLDEAIACFRTALALKPDYAEAHNNLGTALGEQGRPEEAIAFYRRAIDCHPNYVGALNNLGNALKARGRMDEAIACYRRAIELDPSYPGPHNNLGVALREQALLDDAIASFRRAIELDPNYVLAHNNLGTALKEQGRLDEAAAWLRRALELKPDFAEAHNNLGTVLEEQARQDEAIACYRAAIALTPDFPEAVNNLGTAFRAQGRLDEAVASYQRAIELSTNYADAHNNLAMTLLVRGDLAAGWPEYEWRWKTPQPARTRRDFAQPQWRGEPAEGRTLLIHAEQGLGDTLHFCRYAPLAAARRLRVILQVPGPLVRLMRSLPGVDRVVESSDALPDFDLHCPMLSLPLAFGTILATVPGSVPYLRADTAQVAAWQERLAAMEQRGPRIGLVWAGNSRLHSPAGAAVDRRRSIAPDRLAPVFELPGLHFFSLQKDGPAAPGNVTLTDFMGEMVDFADTAALVANLDLVIAVDTSVAHLAGALGKPVWMLDRFDPDWRWLIGRSDSPWYPTLRIFRQPQPGDWDTVVANVRAELAASRETIAGVAAASRHPRESWDPGSMGPRYREDDARRSVDLLVRGSDADGSVESHRRQDKRRPEQEGTPPPLEGGGRGEGCVHPPARDARTPPPGPLPQGEGEFHSSHPAHPAHPDAHGVDPHVRADGAGTGMDPGVHQDHTGAMVAFGDAARQHQAARLDDAAAGYRRALDLRPDFPEAANNLAIVLQAQGRLDEAVACFRGILDLHPDDPEIHVNLAIALEQQGRLDEAAAHCRRAADLKPDMPEAHYNLGNVLQQQGQPDDAIACYRRAIELRPDYQAAHNNLGNALRTQCRLDEAVACFRRVAELRPDDPQAHFACGNMLCQRGNLDEAIACYRRALDLDANYPEACNNLGDLLRAEGRLEEAIASLRRAIDLRRDYADAHNNLGIALQEDGRVDEAVACFHRALQLRPGMQEAHHNLATALLEQGHLDAAVASFRRVLDLTPDSPDAHSNLGVGLQAQGRLDEAIASFGASLAHNPDFPEAHRNLGLALLARGDLEAGWEENEWRWQTATMRKARRDFAQPQWRGEPAEGRTLLIHAEQGFGDTLQFCRYAPLAAARGLRVILEVPRPLVRLLRSLPGVDRVVADGEALPEFDLHCPMLSMPLAMRTTLASIPAIVPYLHADPAQVAAWETRLAAVDGVGPRVGLVWAGNPRKHIPGGAAVDRRRSIGPARLAPLFELPGLHFVSLQKDGPAAPRQFPLTGLMHEMGDFADTAALIANLDLVISVDTAVAHLAAALGKPVWLLDRFDPDWRWLPGRRDSPWYPTLRIFRQPRPGDWAAVVETVRAELGLFVAQGNTPPPTRGGGVFSLKPDLQALFDAAVQHHEAGGLTEAEGLYRQVLAAASRHADSLHLLGVVAGQTGRHDLAISMIGQAIAASPNEAAFHSNLGLSLKQLGRLDEAVTCFRRALDLMPGFPDALNNLGTALREQGRLDEAVACFRRAIDLHPDDPGPHTNLAMALLAQGDWGPGWEEFEWCRRTPLAIKTRRNFVQPQWRGEPAEGQTLLVHAEGLGFGDTLQFCRYAPLAAMRGLRVIMQVQPPLLRLLRSLPGVHRLVGHGEELPQFDLHCPMLSMPLALGTTVTTVPSDVPYLHADPAQVAAWRTRLDAMDDRAPRIGLVWAGNPRTHLPTSAATDRRRSMAPDRLAPLFECPGLHFFSLQKDGPAAPADFPLTDLMGEMGDFADTAALVANLDLVISVDTAVAHLAGALGKPVWLQDRFDPDWRWLLGRRDSPWYPTLRIFRQPRPGDWAAVVESVRAELSTFTADSNTPPPLVGGGRGEGCVQPPASAVRTPPPNPWSASRPKPTRGGGVSSLNSDFQGLFDEAVRHHQAGRLTEAEGLYRQVVAAAPRHADSLHLLGVLAGQTGRHDLAAAMIRQAIAVNPKEAVYHTNLGAALKQQGRLDEAVACFRTALDLRPDDPEAPLNLGIALKELWRLEEAVACYRQAIALRPNFPRAHLNLGNALRDQGRAGEAATYYRQALELQPGYPEAQNALAELPGAQGLGDVATLGRAAPDRTQDTAAAHNDRGMALQRQGRLEQAIAAYRRAIELDPNLPEAHNNLGTALREQARPDEAAACYRRALALKPDYPQAHNNLANALRALGQLDDAVASYRRALQLTPDYPEAYNNLGIALHEQGLLDDAIAAFHRSLELKPGIPDVHNNLGMSLLARGDLLEGWAACEWRWQTPQMATSRRNFAQPPWRGEAAEGRTLLIHAEQGFGDTLQFCRYAPLAAARGLRVILEVPRPLLRLMHSLPGIHRVVEQGGELPEFDLQCPMLSLPPALGTTLATIPDAVPYLRPDSAQAASWRTRIAELGKPGRRVGLVWAGNPRKELPLGAALDRRRSIAPERLAALLELPGLHFFSLQKNSPAAPGHLGLIDFMGDMGDFADTAALIANLDLVISVDTAVAHLAGALGKPVWLLDRFDPDWRWMLGRRDSPWYPTLRIYRQPRLGDWDSVIESVRADLRMFGGDHPVTVEKDTPPPTRGGGGSSPWPGLQALFDDAVRHHQAGRLAEAEPLYGQVLAAHRDHADSLHLLGVIGGQTGRHDLAVEMIGRAIAVNPNVAAFHSNLGMSLKQQGRLDEAAACFRTAVELNPDDPSTHSKLGGVLWEQGNLDEAIGCYRKAVALRPDAATAQRDLGIALQDQGRLDEAVACFRAAVGVAPGDLEAHTNLANVFRDRGQWDEAVTWYRRAAELEPAHPAVHNNLGIALRELGRSDEAVDSLRKAIALKPNYPEAHSNLGTVLHELGRSDEAATCCRIALGLKPDFPLAHNNLGNALRGQGHLDEAVASYRRAIELSPDCAEAHNNLALALLARGDLPAGWQEFEWRWQTPAMREVCRDFTRPQWRGEPAEGRTLLIHAEQGFGDTLQFCRYAPLAAARGLRVVLEAPGPLVRLLRSLPGVAQVIEHGDTLPDFDLHCPLLSMPLALGTTLETIPCVVPYLRPDAAQVAAWNARLAAVDIQGPRIGVVWAGSSHNAWPAWARVDHRRSIDPHRLAPLFESLGLHFVSLQKDGPEAPARFPLTGFMGEMADFADTAALIANLDLVISVDTAVVHLAAALGRPVWLLDRCDPCWRWLTGRSDSPWYPTLRIFRQPHPGDWDAVIENVREELAMNTPPPLAGGGWRHAAETDTDWHAPPSRLSRDVRRLFDDAVRHHQAGRLAEAEPLYRQVMAANPSHADGLHLLGVLAGQTGRHDLAAEMIGRAIAVDPSVAAFRSNLGISLKQQGRLDEAVESFHAALDLAPDDPKTHYNVGIALREQRRLDDAAAAFRKAIGLQPDYPEALNDLGNTLRELGSLDEAAACFRRAHDLQPDYPEALNNLGAVLRGLGLPEQAAACFRAALDLSPNDPAAHNNLAIALQDQGKLDEAVEHFGIALGLGPDDPETHTNLGVALQVQGRLDEAAGSHRQALALRPHFPEALYNLGNVFWEQDCVEQAITQFHQSLDLKPDYAQAHSNLANALWRQGQLDEAVTRYRRAIELTPAYADAHTHLGMALLARGELAEGWQEYEWRWKTGQQIGSRRDFTQPQWRGEPAEGQTLLIHAEQGLGDTLQFCRYASLAAARGMRVIVEVQAPLVRLLRSLAGIDQVLARGEALPDFDLHCPMLSMPPALGTTTVATIPGAVPYLHAGAAQVAAWGTRLAAADIQGPRIGLVWAGNPRKHLPTCQAVDRRRSIAPEHLAPLFDLPGLHFVSLQKDGPAPPPQFKLTDFMTEPGDFADTAALIANLDLVISVDTSVAHLAGALGKPGWLLDRFDPCWRWLTGRSDSPWYPTLRIFRQPHPGDWDAVIETVRAELHLLGGDYSPPAGRNTASPLVGLGREADQGWGEGSLGSRSDPSPQPPPSRGGGDLEFNKADLRTLFGEAVRQHQAGDLAGAERLYCQVLAANPGHADALHLRGVIGGQTGRHDLAVDMIGRAIAIDPGQAAFHCNLGISLRAQERFDEAATCFQTALDLNPDDADAHNNLGIALKDLSRLDVAVACYRRAIELRPNFPRAQLNLGNALTDLGRLEEAADCYRRAIELDPDNPEAHNNLGNVLRDQGQVAEAVACYRQVLALMPDDAGTLNNLGNALRAQGRSDEVAARRGALDLRPDDSEAHFNRGVALRAEGRTDEAIACYLRAIELKPDSAPAHNNLGNALRALGRFDEAAVCLRRAVDLQPDYAEAHNNLGIALQGQGRLDEAAACYRRTLELRPDVAEAHNNLGTVLHDQGRLDEAVACYHKALAFKPDFAVAHNSLGVALQEQGLTDQAAASYRRAIELRPDDTGAHNNLGTALQEQGRLDEAAVSCRTAIGLDPDFGEAHNSLGTTLLEQGRLDEALACYRRAIELNPGYADAHCNLGMALLSRGDLATGWEENEWRWKTPKMQSYRGYDRPQWRGEPAEGRTLLIHAEQGLGDTLQFCRYASMAAARGLRVILKVPQPLVRLLRSMTGVDSVVADEEKLPDFDLHCPMLSLPLALGTTSIAAIPGEVPYLWPEPAQVAAWEARLIGMDRPGVRIGLVWAGNPRKHIPSGAAVDRRRSIAPERLMPLFEQPGVHFLSLQKDGSAAPGQFGLTDVMQEMGDFADTAALVANLDLVISVDTSVAHLAAAMGKPVWLLDRFDACWRWLVGRRDSPWYPTLRIYRQPRPGAWDSVIASVRADLAGFVRDRPPDARSPDAVSPGLATEDAASHYNRGIALQREGRLDEAIASYGRAIALDPLSADAHISLGTALRRQGRPDAAAACFRKAIAIKPDYPEAHNNLGNALRALGRLDEAIAALRRALELQPAYPEAHNNLGLALREQGSLDQAIASGRRAVALMPDFPGAHVNLAVALLARGDLADGWNEYEWRWQTPDMIRGRRNFTQPQWKGEPAAGRTLLIHAEQGYGDTLQFCRYASLAAARGLRVIVEVPTPLVRLLRSLRGVDHVMQHGEALPAFDLHCPMLSLPLALGTAKIASIPGDVPYLSADSGAVAGWRTRLDVLGDRGCRVGLAWAGSPGTEFPAAALAKLRRSIGPERLAPLFDLLGLRFFSLQKDGPGAPAQFPLIDFMGEMADFADTAALVANLDLVISVDTAVAHLAAAMGRPVWLLDRFDPCWRWLLGRSDSPWYPTLRIYRQSRPGDWDPVIESVGAELAGFGSGGLTINRLPLPLWEGVGGRGSCGTTPSPQPPPTRGGGVLSSRTADPEAFVNLGVSLRAQGRVDEAIASYRAAIELKPDHPIAHNNLGNALKALGRLDEAVACLRRAVELKPDYVEAYNNLGIALQGQGRLDEAVACYRRALDLRPDIPEAHNNLGTALQDLGRRDEAIACYRKAIELRPTFADAHNGLGSALQEQGLAHEAAASYRRAIDHKPDFAAAYNNLATALHAQERLDKAEAACRTAIGLSPHFAEAHNSLGTVLLGQGRLDEAIASCRRAVDLRPDYPEPHNNLGMALLARGEMAEGWREFEWRWQTPSMRHGRRDFTQPQWHGEPAKGRTLLIHAEQGLGDTVQFCRYATLAAERGLRVILEVQSPLVRLLRSLPGVGEVVRQGDRLPQFDLHCPMLSMPLAVGTTLATVPNAVPYLHADAQQIAAWGERLAAMGAQRRRAGLVWAGNSHTNWPTGARVDRRRSISPDRLAPLFEVTGVDFVSLQKDGPAAPGVFPLIDCMGEMGDFADTAALIANLDLVVSVDTSVAHLAAALGKPVWLLDRFDPCWRWLAGRRDSPWYPKLRICRQPGPGEWDSVVAGVARDLRRFAGG